MSNIQETMKWLSEQPDTIFVGQNCLYPPTFILCKSLSEVPREKILEFPVAENMQLGFSIGLALTGKTVITCFPRQDFLHLAFDQLVNHLDRYEYLWKGKFFPRIIIRTMVGGTSPLHPGEQHHSNSTEAIKLMCPNIEVLSLEKGEDPLEFYKLAYQLSEHRPVLTVELP